MKALLLHIGADSTNLGHSSPEFEDGTFTFLPIPEKAQQCVTKFYQDLGLAQYVSENYRYKKVHIDPDFRFFTYGEPKGSMRSRQVLKLLPGDMIIFVASLAWNGRLRENMRKAIVGYFQVQAIVECKMRKNKLEVIKGNPISDRVHNRIKNNAHAKRTHDDFICLIGNQNSRLLKHHVPITERGAPFMPNDNGKKIYGNKKFHQGFKWIDEREKVRKLIHLIGM